MELGGLTLRNNFLMSAVKTGYGNGNGIISERHIAFWKRRSKHVGAIIFEPFYLDSRVRELPTQIGIDSDEKIESHKKLVNAIHFNGAKAIAHINHPGRMANPKLPGNIYLSASAVACPNTGKVPEELSLQGILEVQDQYISAAVRAEKAGYDMIELQFGLGYLISQFISPDTNKRNDEYGGSFENRMRFGMEILKKIKYSVSLPIIVRISGDEMIPGGLNIDDAVLITGFLKDQNIAAVHVTSGNVCLSPPWYYQHHFIPKGKNWEMAKKIKEASGLPVIAVGQINEPADVEQIIGSGSADFIALGRALIADPDFVGKYLKEVDGNIRPCSSCLTGCLGRIKIGKGLQCEINPEVGRELEELKPAEIKKNFAVVGGGLAGMEAAITLKQRGHKVTLFEKEKLGGQFNYAPMPSNKTSLQKQIDYFIDEMKGIKIINAEAGPDDLIGKYDGIVAATGSFPVVPKIEGLVQYNWAEILTKQNIPLNKKALIIGGGMIGVEVAVTLADYGNSVTIVEMLDELARGMEMVTRKLNLMKLQKNGVRVLLNTAVSKVDGTTVFTRDSKSNKITAINEVDVIVVAAGMKPDKELAGKLEGKIPVYLIGDATEVGDAVSAVQSAYFVCREL